MTENFMLKYMNSVDHALNADCKLILSKELGVEYRFKLPLGFHMP